MKSVGVEVSVMEMVEEILGGMEKEVWGMVGGEYGKGGIKLMVERKVVGVWEVGWGNGEREEIEVNYENGEGGGCVIGERLLMRVGGGGVRKGLGLEKVNLDKRGGGNIEVEGEMESWVGGVYGWGDLRGFCLVGDSGVGEGEVGVDGVVGKKECMS